MTDLTDRLAAGEDLSDDEWRFLIEGDYDKRLLFYRADEVRRQYYGTDMAIARALVNNPSTIIADEPTGNLDPERAFEIMALLQEINNLGTTLLVVTHAQNLVNVFHKRVIAINDGLVVSDGTEEEYNHEAE